MIPHELGGGLFLRQATAADTEALVDCNGAATGNWETGEPDEGTAIWTRDLLEGRHPNVSPGDFTVVEDTSSGAIVSSICLISHTWTLGGIPVGVGEAQLVGTRPAYRRRGLVRAQFGVVHRWSAERGQKVQIVSGIPWYYRQFGYELALGLGGGRTGFPSTVPALEEKPEPYRVRPASEADLAFVARLYEHAAKRSMVASRMSEAEWRYELLGKSANRPKRLQWQIIETAVGEPVGYLAHAGGWFPTLAVPMYHLLPRASWLAVTPSVMRYLRARLPSPAAPEAAPAGTRGASFTFELGTEHPVYALFSDCLPLEHRAGAWYVRVADLPDFLRHIAPVLEERLAESSVAGLTGTVEISFYRNGLRLEFEQGRLTHVERWVPEHPNFGDARFPELTFLQLLFGHRSVQELEYAFADCGAETSEARVLLNALFPKQPSAVYAVA
jgi:predicted N-acetyltransferase YhbS